METLLEFKNILLNNLKININNNNIIINDNIYDFNTFVNKLLYIDHIYKHLIFINCDYDKYVDNININNDNEYLINYINTLNTFNNKWLFKINYLINNIDIYNNLIKLDINDLHNLDNNIIYNDFNDKIRIDTISIFFNMVNNNNDITNYIKYKNTNNGLIIIKNIIMNVDKLFKYSNELTINYITYMIFILKCIKIYNIYHFEKERNRNEFIKITKSKSILKKKKYYNNLINVNKVLINIYNFLNHYDNMLYDCIYNNKCMFNKFEKDKNFLKLINSFSKCCNVKYYKLLLTIVKHYNDNTINKYLICDNIDNLLFNYYSRQ